MTGYELVIHPMVEVANELIRWVRLDVGLPESILPDKMIKDDVMASFRIVNWRYLTYFFGDINKEDNDADLHA